MADQYEPFEWQCPKCTYINKKADRSCQICEFNRKMDSNPENESYSKYKNAFRSKLNSLGSDVKNFINGLSPAATNGPSTSSKFYADDRDVIEISPHSKKPVSRLGSAKLWTCSSCTFAANPDWKKTCEVCDHKRDSAIEVDPDDADLKIYDTTLDKNVYDYARIWTCKRCTYINFEKDKRCELCSASRNSKHSGKEDPLKYKWLCKVCTYLNDHSADKCLSCNSGKNESGPPDSAAASSQARPGGSKKYSSQWVCEVCSHKNPPNTQICELCENNVENILNDDDDDVVSLPFDGNNRSLSLDGDYFNSTMNPSLTYRSQKAMSTLKTYTNATNHAEKIWKNIIKYCKEQNHKFIDDSFPPCDKSLFINQNKKPANLMNRGIQWLSPERIRTPHHENSLRWSVYNSPKFNDIKQGLLGNCWLLSGLAVILEQPELLNKIIITKDYCPQGCYQVRLCHNGEWQTVILDDLFPCDSNGYLLYSQASRKQLWVPLIEKAMAKLNGSYESLVAGQTVEGLSALTGYPCDSISLEKLTDDEEEIDLEMVWVKLLSMKEAGYALGASCGKTNIEDDTMFTNHGLLPRHAYSILDVKEVSGNQLVQLRNPWGRYTWTGDWSENSSKWTPAMRKALGMKQSGPSSKQTSSRQDDNHFYNHHQSRASDEGVFWISFYDFVKYFCSIDICKARLDWFESRMSGYFSPEGTREMQAYHLIVFETSEINIGLFHKTIKNRRENSDLDLCFAVLRSNGGRNSIGKLVKSPKRAIRKFVGLEHIFEPGEYLIVPFSFNFWYTTNSETNGKDNNLYNLVFHSPKTFFIEQEMHSALLLADTIIQLCLTLGTKTYSGIEKACIYTLAKGHSGLIVVGENFNERSYLHIELDCQNSSNVVSTRQALLTKDSVPPLHRQVLLLLTQLEGSSCYSIQYSIKYRLSSNPYLNTWPGNEGAYFTNSPEITKKTFGLHAPRSVFL